MLAVLALGQRTLEFGSKSALGSRIALPGALSSFVSRLSPIGGGVSGLLASFAVFWFGRLCRIGSEEPVFEWRTIKAADDRLHLVRCRSLDKGEALRFLSFVIANDFDRVSYEVFRTQPLLDIVSGNPGGQVAQEYSEAHSVVFFTPF